MAGTDVIRFDAYIKKGNTVVAYIMPLVTNTAYVQFKNEFVGYIDQSATDEANVSQRFSNEVEL